MPHEIEGRRLCVTEDEPGSLVDGLQNAWAEFSEANKTLELVIAQMQETTVTAACDKV